MRSCVPRRRTQLPFRDPTLSTLSAARPCLSPFSMNAAQFRSILLIRAVMISMGSSLGSKGVKVSSWVTVASQPERVTISSYQYYTSTSLNHHYKPPVSCDCGSEQPLSPPFPRTEFNTNTVYHSYRVQASFRVEVSDR